MKINRFLFGAVLSFLLLVGCTTNDADTEKSVEGESRETENINEEVESEKPDNERIEFGEDDAAIQEAITSEEDVETVELVSSSDGKAVFLDVYVTSEEFDSSEALADKYAPQLQALHPEAKIDVVFAHGMNMIVYETVIEPVEE